MHNRRLNAHHDLDEGFTLIELLVVTLIIGVLASIAIPVFVSQRETAYLAGVRSELKNASVAAETFAVAAQGDYSSLDTAALEQYGFHSSDDVEVAVVSEQAGYTIVAVSTALGVEREWTYSSATGTISGP